MSQEADARTALREYYRSAIEGGMELSLKRLADMSVDIVGRSFSYDVIRVWATQDNWDKILERSMGSSPLLKDAKSLFDKALEDLLKEEKDWLFYASSARSFVSVARSIPSAYSLVIESGVVSAYDRINLFLQDHWDGIPPTHRNALVAAWGQLKKLLPGEVFVEPDGVNPDAILLSDRPK